MRAEVPLDGDLNTSGLPTIAVEAEETGRAAKKIREMYTVGEFEEILKSLPADIRQIADMLLEKRMSWRQIAEKMPPAKENALKNRFWRALQHRVKK
jgi:hypothetical protein